MWPWEGLPDAEQRPGLNDTQGLDTPWHLNGDLPPALPSIPTATVSVHAVLCLFGIVY